MGLYALWISLILGAPGVCLHPECVQAEKTKYHTSPFFSHHCPTPPSTPAAQQDSCATVSAEWLSSHCLPGCLGALVGGGAAGEQPVSMPAIVKIEWHLLPLHGYGFRLDFT